MAMSFMVDVKAAMVFVVVIPLLSVVVFGDHADYNASL